MREKPPVALGTPIGLRELLEAAPDALFCCDAQGRFQWLNSAIEPLTGHPLVELLGHSFADLVDSSHHQAMARFYLRQQRRRLPVSEHSWVLRSIDGADVPVSVRVRRYERLDGDVAFVGCLRAESRDPAPEPQHSPQLVASQAPPSPEPDLHQVPSPGDAEIRLRLITDEMEAARADARVKDELLRMLVHEIRTPMNGVLAMTHLLLEWNQDPDQRDLLQNIYGSSQALVTMANDAADFSVLHAGTCAIETIDFDLRVTVGEVGTMLAPFALDKEIRVESQVSHEVPSRLRGDPGRLRQVLFNLAGAALRLGGPGALRVSVEREREEERRVELRFAVSCSSATVAEEESTLLGRVYGAGALPEAGQLVGGALGLSIARNLVERMGGEGGLERSGEGGLRLWFRLPLEKQPPAAAPAETPEIQLRGLRVLVVDPAQSARQSSMEMLLAWGCRAEQVEQGEPALSRLREAAAAGDPYRLAAVELQLPDMDGLEFAERVRAERSLEETLLVMVATVGSRGDAARAQAAGFSAYLPKPVGWSELHEALTELVRRGSSTRSLPIVTRHSLADARRARVRILLVDDDLVNQLVAKSVLSRSGFHVDVAGSGAEAIEACERQRYDLILMDAQMSDLDGYQTATALRARERGQHTPIVGMGGGARERSIEAGMDDHLPKPIDLAELCKLVEGWTVEAANWEPVAKTGEPEAPRERPEITAVIASSDPLPILDVARLEESCMGMEDLRESLLEAFLNDVQPRVDRLSEAIQAGDARRLRFESHGLRGMCLTIGTAACARVFAELETMGRETRLGEARAMLQRAHAEVERAQRRIEAYREELRSGTARPSNVLEGQFGDRKLPPGYDDPGDIERAA